MNKTLQDQYLKIKEGNGHKGVFLTEVKRNFPNIVPQSANFELASKILKDKNIISENIVGMQAINQIPATKKQPFESAFENFLKEAKKKEATDKAEAKTTSKDVEETQKHAYDNKDMKDPNNVIFDQLMTGYYAEMKDPKNAEKTMEELKEIVLKNLAKDPIFYTKDGQFGEKGLGYTTEHPGLGEPKEAKGKHKASGYGDLNENQTLNEIKSNTSKMFNWFWGKHESAKETQHRIRDYSDNVLLSLFKNKPSNITPKSPSSIQQELLRKEINRRGLNIEDMSINESKIRNVIKGIIKEELSKISLNENLPKRLKEIENESLDEVKMAKLEKLKAEVEKRQSQLDMIESNEDLKGLTDGKKIKALQKEIKTLEKAIAKLEKTTKGKAKEVIDENEDEPSEEYLAAKQDAEDRYHEGEDLDQILQDYPEFDDMLRLDIQGGFEGLDY